MDSRCSICEIDPDSGFCHGVMRAVNKAEEFLSGGGRLYSLGAMVHNTEEIERLASKGLATIDIEGMKSLEAGSTVLIRAHGEPPATYSLARSLDITIIDCTCPVVLKLQRDIAAAFKRVSLSGGSVVIFGKRDHAEVNGLVGQTGGKAVVIENLSEIDQLDFSHHIELFSQTTRDPGEYEALKLETDTGDVTFHGEFTFLKLDVETDTGDVELGGTFATSVRIKTDTGDVTVTPLTASDVGIRTTTGKVSLTDAACADLAVETDTGKVKLTDVSCAALTVETDTGDVILKNVVGTGDAKIETDTGDVKLDRCDAANYKIKTDTGDVEGTILSEKFFSVSSHLGDENVPKTRSGGDFEASSDTGDIEIEIAE